MEESTTFDEVLSKPVGLLLSVDPFHTRQYTCKDINGATPYTDL